MISISVDKDDLASLEILGKALIGIAMVKAGANVAPAVAPEAPEAPEAPGTVLDVNGLPWDERIHGTNKNKNKDGSWRNIKGVDKELLASVEAELMGKTVADVTPAIIVPPPAPETVPSALDLALLIADSGRTQADIDLLAKGFGFDTIKLLLESGDEGVLLAMKKSL